MIDSNSGLNVGVFNTSQPESHNFTIFYEWWDVFSGTCARVKEFKIVSVCLSWKPLLSHARDDLQLETLCANKTKLWSSEFSLLKTNRTSLVDICPIQLSVLYVPACGCVYTLPEGCHGVLHNCTHIYSTTPHIYTDSLNRLFSWHAFSCWQCQCLEIAASEVSSHQHRLQGPGCIKL